MEEHRKDDRKNVKVSWGTKTAIETVKSVLKCRNESQAIAYMYAIWEREYYEQSVKDHEQALKRAEEIENQGTIFL